MGHAHRCAARPRVTGPREQEILDAALAEIAERGYDRVTLDAVAARARASKATLYRKWTTKADLVVDAVASRAQENVPDVDTGSLAGDLEALTVCGVPLLRHGAVDLVGGLLTAMQRDPDLACAVEARFLVPGMLAARLAFERAEARGEIPAGSDLDLLTQIVPALVFFRSSTTGVDGDLDEFVRHVVRHVVLPAARGGPDRRAPRRRPQPPT